MSPAGAGLQKLPANIFAKGVQYSSKGGYKWTSGMTVKLVQNVPSSRSFVTTCKCSVHETKEIPEEEEEAIPINLPRNPMSPNRPVIRQPILQTTKCRSKHVGHLVDRPTETNNFCPLINIPESGASLRPNS